MEQIRSIEDRLKSINLEEKKLVANCATLRAKNKFYKETIRSLEVTLNRYKEKHEDLETTLNKQRTIISELNKSLSRSMLKSIPQKPNPDLLKNFSETLLKYKTLMIKHQKLTKEYLKLKEENDNQRTISRLEKSILKDRDSELRIVDDEVTFKEKYERLLELYYIRKEKERKNRNEEDINKKLMESLRQNQILKSRNKNLEKEVMKYKNKLGKIQKKVKSMIKTSRKKMNKDLNNSKLMYETAKEENSLLEHELVDLKIKLRERENEINLKDSVIEEYILSPSKRLKRASYL